jgi:hypothetical protein
MWMTTLMTKQKEHDIIFDPDATGAGVEVWHYPPKIRFKTMWDMGAIADVETAIGEQGGASCALFA